MVSKSLLTGTIFDSSSGGFFGKELKFAGIDMLFIKGASDEPVYISIQEDDIEYLKEQRTKGVEEWFKKTSTKKIVDDKLI